jgi:hypothetical protein
VAVEVEGAGEGVGVGFALVADLRGDGVPALEDLHEEVLHGRQPEWWSRGWPERAGGLGFGHGGGSGLGEMAESTKILNWGRGKTEIWANGVGMHGEVTAVLLLDARSTARIDFLVVGSPCFSLSGGLTCP